MNVSNINFKGCKNLISENVKSPSGCQLTMLAGELTNEVSPDLAKWHEIQKCMGEQQISDTFALIYSNAKPLEMMIINNQVILYDDEMPSCKGAYKKIKNPEIEKATLGLYTLLARVTHNISNSASFERDKNYVNVFKNMLNTLKLVCNEQLANKTAILSVSNFNFQQTATVINEIIKKTMTAYFK